MAERRRAFERGLADSGLQRSDIDGLSASFIYGGPQPCRSSTNFRMTDGFFASHII
jgi:hypothetical protein